MKYVVWNILYCTTIILMYFFLRLHVFNISACLSLPVSCCLSLCVSICLSNSQPTGTPKVHSNSAQHSRLQNKHGGQVAVIYTSPQSRLNFTDCVIAL